ncbi:taste receptor type 2 member 19-like [Echinops telfairi]|uniref:Taste receptor type 2 n=1 Tax=Echinops telfairi TaxID=9371 RepID=A0ABM0J6Z4_ECHTE|nr:taste receptor type 2 member 19-like [Echinops telfairi]
MLTSVESIVSTIALVELVPGVFANAFIATVSCVACMKTQKLSSADKILFAVAVSRFGLLWAMIINWYIFMFNPGLHGPGRGTSIIFWIVMHHFSIWFASGLSVFYLFKIANFSNLTFHHLQWRVERVVLAVLLGSLVFLGFQLAVEITENRILKNTYEGNMTLKTELGVTHALSSLTVFTLENIIPFTMSLISLLLLIFSLWKHLKKMKFNGTGSQDASTKAHIKAMLSVISFLLLFTISVFCLIIPAWLLKMLQNQKTLLLLQMISITLPSSHSLILVVVNPKLKKALLSLLGQWKERLGLT